MAYYILCCFKGVGKTNMNYKKVLDNAPDTYFLIKDKDNKVIYPKDKRNLFICAFGLNVFTIKELNDIKKMLKLTEEKPNINDIPKKYKLTLNEDKNIKIKDMFRKYILNIFLIYLFWNIVRRE